jgi:hypothetical protein
MPFPKVSLEGRWIRVDELPPGAVRVDGVWYTDPSKIPEQYKTARVGMPAYKAEIAKNGGILPVDMQEALETRMEDAKKKSKKPTEVAVTVDETETTPTDPSIA